LNDYSYSGNDDGWESYSKILKEMDEASGKEYFIGEIIGKCMIDSHKALCRDQERLPHTGRHQGIHDVSNSEATKDLVPLSQTKIKNVENHFVEDIKVVVDTKEETPSHRIEKRKWSTLMLSL
jgi:hypothetical protein